MLELQEIAIALFFIGANAVAFLGGLLGFLLIWRRALQEGVRVPLLVYPFAIGVFGFFYWHFVRAPLGDGAPVFTEEFVRSIMGLVVITTAPCLVWLSPAIVAALWRRIRSSRI